jgi:hypothetical protein
MSSRWGAVSGVLLVLFWSPMAVAIPILPDLDSATEVTTFWRHNMSLMQMIVCSVSVGFLFLLFFLGALVHYLLEIRASPAVTWTAYGSVLMFMTALNVAIGLDIAGGLMLSTSSEGTYVLHTAGFLLAAPAAFAGSAFFVAVAVAAFIDHAFPRWSGWLAVVGVVANIGAIFGVFALSGPLNSGNGVIGGIAAPLGTYMLWVLTVSVWWLRSSPRVQAATGRNRGTWISRGARPMR